METPTYISVPLKDIPKSIVDNYDLNKKSQNNKAYFKVVMTMYGHPVSGLLPISIYSKLSRIPVTMKIR